MRPSRNRHQNEITNVKANPDFCSSLSDLKISFASFDFTIKGNGASWMCSILFVSDMFFFVYFLFQKFQFHKN